MCTIGQTLRGVTMKKVWWGRNKKPIWKWCQLGNKCFPIYMCFSFNWKLCICQDPRIARVYTAQNTKICAFLACLAQPTYPIPARCGTDTAGRGAFEPLHEDGARTKLFDREFQFRESHTEAETEKTPDRSPPKKEWSYIYLYTFASLSGWGWLSYLPFEARISAASLSQQLLDAWDTPLSWWHQVLPRDLRTVCGTLLPPVLCAAHSNYLLVKFSSVHACSSCSNSLIIDDLETNGLCTTPLPPCIYCVQRHIDDSIGRCLYNSRDTCRFKATPEIDGLRAAALLQLVRYHAGNA